MDQYSLAQEFVDLMAKALQILVQASERDLYALDAMKASTAIGNDVKQKIAFTAQFPTYCLFFLFALLYKKHEE